LNINTQVVRNSKAPQENTKRKLEQTLSAYIGRLYKDISGRGPENVYVAFGDRSYVVYIKNYIMPYERIIQEDGDKELLNKVIQISTKNINSQIVRYIEFITDVSTDEIYYDWNLETGSRLLVGVSNRKYDIYPTAASNYFGEQLLNKEIIKMGHFTDSIPETVTSYCLNSKFFVFERNGGMTRLEKEMESNGHGDVVKNTKRQIEKEYIRNNFCVKNILDTESMDIFIDWNFKKDKSLVVLVKSASEAKVMNLS